MDKPSWIYEVGKPWQLGDPTKNPMLVVGTNYHIRKSMGSIYNYWDIYLLYSPTKEDSKVAYLAIERTKASEPLFVYTTDLYIDIALEKITQLLKLAIKKDRIEKNGQKKLNVWWTQWVYRCPKISLRDILAFNLKKEVVNE